MADATIKRVDDPQQRRMAQMFVNANHSYIKWAERPSRRLYWTLYEDERMVGVFGLASAFTRPEAIASFMKASALHFNEVGNNIVFCLNGHQDRNMGSKVLKLLRHDSARWWRDRYGDTLKAIQTFILPPRTGSVYKADNWRYIGMTSGSGAVITRSINRNETENYQSVETRVFRSGEIRYLVREYHRAEPKLIFVRALP